MGELHEKALAAAFEARKTTASGSKWHDQGDIRNGHDTPFAYCLDGKSTLSKSITVTLDMIAKIREQAQGERPGFGLRWYGTGDLKTVLEDLVLLQLADVEEMLPAARGWVELEAALGGRITPERVSELLASAAEHSDTIERLQAELEDARIELNGVSVAEQMVAGDLEALHTRLAGAEADRDRYKAQAEAVQPYGSPQTAVPGFVPRLPWTVIHMVHVGSGTVRSGTYYDPQGHQHPFTVGTVRVERSGMNRPRLMVNEVRVSDGDLYVGGVHQVRACADGAIEEMG
jgi:hypothetical protein